jgi:CDP-glucose 4,6-dehydratase
METGKRFEESDPLEGFDPYSASKVGTEAAVMAWRSLPSNSGVSISALRAGNVIGGGDYSDNRLLPDIVRAAFLSQGLQIRNKNATRPWQHVLDPLMGYLLAIEYSMENGISPDFNFGPEEESLAVGDVIDCVLENEFFRSKLGKIEFGSAIEHEAQFLSLNASKATSLLGWKPAWSQKEAIKATMHWWETVMKNEADALGLCQTEIERVLSGYR